MEKIVLDENIRKGPYSLDIGELSSSVEQHGILQPLTVEPREDGLYTLIIGHRRLIAAKEAGLTTVPAIVTENHIEKFHALETKLTENLQRKNLDPIDEAEAYFSLKNRGQSIGKIAKRLGKSRYYVSKRIRLMGLHPKLRDAVRRRTLTPGHAHSLLRIKDQELQLILANEIFKENLSVMETRRRVRASQGQQLKWRLIPVRIKHEEFDMLKKIASDGDVKNLIEETIRKLVSSGTKLEFH